MNNYIIFFDLAFNDKGFCTYIFNTFHAYTKTEHKTNRTPNQD